MEDEFFCSIAKILWNGIKHANYCSLNSFFDKTTLRIEIGGRWYPVPPSGSFGHLQDAQEEIEETQDHENHQQAP